MRNLSPLTCTLTAALISLVNLGCSGSGGAPAKTVNPATKRAHKRMLFDIFNKIPPSPAKHGTLEDGDGWKMADWEDAASVQRITDHKSGRSVIYIAAEGNEKGKCGAVLTKDLHLAAKGKLRVALYNYTGRATKLALAIWVSDDWTYYESPVKIIPPGGWTQTAFDLSASDFKTESSKWKHTAALWKREGTKQVALLIYHEGMASKLLVDGLEIDQAAPKTLPGPPPKPVLHKTP